MIGVGHDYVGPCIRQLPGSLRQPFLIFPGEESLVVIDEAVVVVPRNVRRIEVDKIARLDILQRRLEITGPELHTRLLKSLGACPEILEVRNGVRLGHAVGNIETPSGVDAVKPIPTGLVEIQKLGRPLQPSPTRRLRMA